jgi:hypothetical protein
MEGFIDCFNARQCQDCPALGEWEQPCGATPHSFTFVFGVLYEPQLLRCEEEIPQKNSRNRSWSAIAQRALEQVRSTARYVILLCSKVKRRGCETLDESSTPTPTVSFLCSPIPDNSRFIQSSAFKNNIIKLFSRLSR